MTTARQVRDDWLKLLDELIAEDLEHEIKAERPSERPMLTLIQGGLSQSPASPTE